MLFTVYMDSSKDLGWGVRVHVNKNEASVHVCDVIFEQSKTKILDLAKN